MTPENIFMVLVCILLILFVFGIVLALIGKEFLDINGMIYNLRERVRDLELQNKR